MSVVRSEINDLSVLYLKFGNLLVFLQEYIEKQSSRHEDVVKTL